MELNDTQPWAVTIAERDALAADVERLREVIWQLTQRHGAKVAENTRLWEALRALMEAEWMVSTDWTSQDKRDAVLQQAGAALSFQPPTAPKSDTEGVLDDSERTCRTCKHKNYDAHCGGCLLFNKWEAGHETRAETASTLL